MKPKSQEPRAKLRVLIALVASSFILHPSSFLLADPPAAATIGSSKNPLVFNVKDYGAKGDCRVFRDGAVTSSSTTLTSATAAFTAADVGRTVSIELTSTNRQLTTIASVTNATTAVLTAAATGTASGATCYIGTDDTPAFIAAFAAWNNMGNGSVVAPADMYMMAGALLEGSGRNAVILIPNPNTVTSQQIRTLYLRGETQASAGYSGYFSYPSSTNGTVLYFPINGSGTNPSAFCGNASGSWTSVDFVVENIDVRLPRNPSIGGYNFATGGTVDLEHSAVVTDNPNFSTTSSVPSTSTVGIWLPGTSNNGKCVLNDCTIIGMGIGVRSSEHSYLQGCFIAQCSEGMHLDVGIGTYLFGTEFNACPVDIGVEQTGNPVLYGFGVQFGQDGTLTDEIGDAAKLLRGFLSYSSQGAALKSRPSSSLQTFGDVENSFNINPFINSDYSTTGGVQLKPADSSGFSLIGFQSAAGVELGNLICNETFGKQLILTARNGASVLVLNTDGHGMEIPDGGNGDLHANTGSFITDTVGQTLAVKSGANAKAGTFTLTAGTVTVANTGVDANSVVIVTLKTAGGTRAGNPDIVPTAGTGFVATGGSSDTSTYNYVIVEVN
jgi:hypothetical protein